MQEFILATDLDETLIGNDYALLELNKLLTKLRDNKKLKLIYVTGRSLPRYKELEVEKKLLIPDALITAVGTQVYIDSALIQDWPKVDNWDSGLIKKRLSKFNYLKNQPAIEQKDFKVSYYLDSMPNFISDIKTELNDLEVDVLYSSNLYLDILPKGVNKGSALEFLASNLSMPISNVISCGDSENDIAMLSVAKAIIVGNAQSSLLEWSNGRDSNSTYIAANKYAAGIIEGLNHFQVLK